MVTAARYCKGVRCLLSTQLPFASFLLLPCQRCRMCALAALRTEIALVTLRLATSERATNQPCASCNNVDAWIKSEFTLTSFYCTSCSPETAKAIATKFTYCC